MNDVQQPLASAMARSRSHPHVHLAMVLILVGSYGCAESSSSTLTEADASTADVLWTVPACVPLEDLQYLMAKATCAEKDLNAHWFPDYRAAGGCEANHNTSLLAHTIGAKIHLTVQGRLTYDCEKASECVAKLPEVPWESRRFAHEVIGHTGAQLPRDYATLPAACTQSFGGSLGAGQDCDDSAECSPKLVCWGCPGTCRKPSPRGGPCNATTGCDRQSLCEAGVCVENHDFAPGSLCETAQSERPTFGAEHFPTWQCAAGSVCAFPGPYTEATCLPVSGLSAEGAACSWNEQCQFGACDPATATCKRTAPGESCNVVADLCGSAAECLGSVQAGVCWPRQATGLPCGTTVCALDQYCQGTTSPHCVALPRVGEPCCANEPGECDFALDPVCYNAQCNSKTSVCEPLARDHSRCPKEMFAKYKGCLDTSLGAECSKYYNSRCGAGECVNGVCRTVNPACTMKP